MLHDDNRKGVKHLRDSKHTINIIGNYYYTVPVNIFIAIHLTLCTQTKWTNDTLGIKQWTLCYY